MIWRAIQVIGAIIIIIGFIMLGLTKPYWLSVTFIGVIVLLVGRAMRFITRN